jgi:hypothetical protein
MIFGSRGNNPVSRFLADIPEKYIVAPGSESKLFGTRQRTSQNRAQVGSSWGFDAEGNCKWNPDENNY